MPLTEVTCWLNALLKRWSMKQLFFSTFVIWGNDTQLQKHLRIRLEKAANWWLACKNAGFPQKFTGHSNSQRCYIIQWNLVNTICIIRFSGYNFFFQPTSHRIFNVFSYGYSDCVFTWNWVIRLQKCAFTGISKTRSFIFRCTSLNSITATHEHCVKPQPHWRKNAGNVLPVIKRCYTTGTTPTGSTSLLTWVRKQKLLFLLPE